MIFLLYLVLPIIEIYLLIKAGGLFGFWPILAIVILTAWIGSRLVKYEGFQVLTQLQRKAAQGESPHREMIEGAVLLIGGLLLIAPGFITDSLGILCLIPFTRKRIAYRIEGWLMNKIKNGRVHVFTAPGFGWGGGFGTSASYPPTVKDVTPNKEQIENQDQ